MKIVKNSWKRDPEISWYGAGLYGNGTACGQTLTKTLVGVAHRTLPCGTKVQFRYNGKVGRSPSSIGARTWVAPVRPVLRGVQCPRPLLHGTDRMAISAGLTAR